MCSTADYSHLEQDDFASPKSEPNKQKYSGWHKRRQTPSPVTTADTEQEQKSTKRAKTECSLSLSLPEPAKPKIEEIKTPDDVPMPDAEHLSVVQCSHCRAKSGFVKNEETELVCGNCCTVISSPEMRRHFDSLDYFNPEDEDKRFRREVCVCVCVIQPVCAQEKLDQVFIGSGKTEGKFVHLKSTKSGKRTKAPQFKEHEPRPETITVNLPGPVTFKNVDTIWLPFGQRPQGIVRDNGDFEGEWDNPMTFDFYDEQLPSWSIHQKLLALRWRGRRYFPLDIIYVVEHYLFDLVVYLQHRESVWRPIAQFPRDPKITYTIAECHCPDTVMTAILKAREQEWKRLQASDEMKRYQKKLLQHQEAMKEWKKQHYEPEHKQFNDKRVEKIDIGKAIDKVLNSEKIKLGSNHIIRTRALQLAEGFLQKQTVINRNRETLAAVCVWRAACENLIGLSHRDLTLFIADSHTFNQWKRDLKAKLGLKNDISRLKLLLGYINVFVNRMVFDDKKDGVDKKERNKMHCLASWIGSARVHRIESEGKNAKRTLKCLPVFLNMLARSDPSIPSIQSLLSKESQQKDECIQLPSLATAIIYVVLYTRPRSKPTQKALENLTGVSTNVIMACKRSLYDVIQRAFDASNSMNQTSD